MSNNCTMRVVNDKYQLFGTIGVGNYGRVYEGIDMTNKTKVAVKELYPEVVNNQELMNITYMEIDILTKINHRYIVKLLDHFSIGPHYYLVYEYCDGGDLKYNVDKKGKFDEMAALKVVYMMIEALCELKRHLIIHRDIKPENVFIKDDLCKLGDFGLCHKGDRVQLGASVGSLGFLAPETQLDLIYSSKADVYSLGICFFEMMHGDIPFTPDQINDLYNVKMKLRIERRPDVQISDRALDLMRRMVDPNEDTRIGCFEVRDILAPLFPAYQPSADEISSQSIHQIRQVNPQPSSPEPVNLIRDSSRSNQNIASSILNTSQENRSPTNIQPFPNSQPTHIPSPNIDYAHGHSSLMNSKSVQNYQRQPNFVGSPFTASQLGGLLPSKSFMNLDSVQSSAGLHSKIQNFGPLKPAFNNTYSFPQRYSQEGDNSQRNHHLDHEKPIQNHNGPPSRTEHYGNNQIPHEISNQNAPSSNMLPSSSRSDYNNYYQLSSPPQRGVRGQSPNPSFLGNLNFAQTNSLGNISWNNNRVSQDQIEVHHNNNFYARSPPRHFSPVYPQNQLSNSPTYGHNRTFNDFGHSFQQQKVSPFSMRINPTEPAPSNPSVPPVRGSKDRSEHEDVATYNYNPHFSQNSSGTPGNQIDERNAVTAIDYSKPITYKPISFRQSNEDSSRREGSRYGESSIPPNRVNPSVERGGISRAIMDGISRPFGIESSVNKTIDNEVDNPYMTQNNVQTDQNKKDRRYASIDIALKDRGAKQRDVSRGSILSSSILQRTMNRDSVTYQPPAPRFINLNTLQQRYNAPPTSFSRKESN